MTRPATDPALSEVAALITRLVEAIPADQRPEGLEDVAALATRLGAHAGAGARADLPDRLEAARGTLAELVAEAQATPAEPWTTGADPAESLRLGRALAHAWAQRDGAEVDRLLETLATLEAPDPAVETARKDRIQRAVSSSIAASMRRAGVPPIEPG